MINLSLEYKKSSIVKEKKSYKGLDEILNTFYGIIYKKYIMRINFKKRAEEIYELSLRYQALSDEEIDKLLLKYIRYFRLNKKEEVLDGAIALLGEVTYRVQKMRPYSVQIMGILAQNQNFAIEMMPGEGKSITATISAILLAWNGKPCHIATSNDYLASRDAEEMQELYNRCNLSVASVSSTFNDEQRREAYKNNVVYTTSKELLADFLRDYIKDINHSYDQSLINYIKKNRSSSNEKVMRGLYTAIIDEADSVLVDDALTPLIISKSVKNEDLNRAVIVSKLISESLILDVDYTLDYKFKDISLTESGKEKSYLDKEILPTIWQSEHRIDFLVKQSLSAKYFFLKEQDYVIDEEGKVVIVDEKTGRIMEGRTWSSGLHQAIEAKENLELTDATKTEIKMSFQRFFRLYPSLSGMSGTLQGLQKELWQIYKLPIIKIPKRIANTYTFKKEIICASSIDKWEKVLLEIIQVHQTTRPILVGTRNIEESKMLSEMLDEKDVKYTLLNALEEKEEASIVLQAGKLSSITIATNIAGRGTDIKISKEIENLGGLHVIATQKFSSIRIDLQLYGRTSRQGQKGSVQVIYSLEDELIKQVSSKWFLAQLKRYVNTQVGFYLSKFLYIHLQNKIEKKSSRTRHKNLKNDFDLIERLSFSQI